MNETTETPAAGATVATPTPAADRPAAPICFADVETDGIHPGRKPWEIAIIRREPDGRQTEWAAFVDIDLSTADPMGLRIGGFYERHPFGRYVSLGDDAGIGSALIPTQAAIKVAQLTHGAVVIGINPGFDVDVLDQLLRAHGLVPSWDYTPVCAKAHAAGWLAGRGLIGKRPPWKTADVIERLGIEISDEDRHTALGDARLAMRMFDAVSADDTPATPPSVDVDAVVDPDAVRPDALNVALGVGRWTV